MNTQDNIKVRRLSYLDKLDDYKVHSDDPDVRDWDVYSSSGEKIGEVENLVVDQDDKVVRYVVVELEDDLYRDRDRSFFERVSDSVRDFFGDDDDQHILIPVGRLELDTENERLIATGMNSRQYAGGPRYRYDKESFFSPGYEVAVAQYCTLPEEDYYNSYRDKKYESTDFTNTRTIRDRSFYDTGLFSRKHYFRHSRNANTTQGASVDTGARRV